MANLHRLGIGATRKIKTAIDDLYDKVKTRLLGPNATGKRIYVTFDRNFSIPGIFEAGSYEESVKPDLDILESLIRVTKDYLDASKERTKAKVIHEINGLIAGARHSGGMDRTEFRGVVNTKLSEVWADATNSVHTIIDTEVNHAKNVSVLDGIVGANLHSGVEDPVVYFVVVRDEDLCDECKRLHLLSDGKTPRVWKLSELSHGYHKKGEDSPSIGGLHPHCRCTLVTLMPGYGFTEGGFVAYKKAGYLEYDKQHSLERSEQPLSKSRMVPKKHWLADLPPGKRVDRIEPEGLYEGADVYDYNHVLPNALKKKGYSLQLLSHDWGGGPDFQKDAKSWRVVVSHNGNTVGQMESCRSDYRSGSREGQELLPDQPRGELDPTHEYNSPKKPQFHFVQAVELDPAHQHQGLGKAMYLASLLHGWHHHGLRWAAGDDHSSSAHRVWQSLARQHELNYNPGKSDYPKEYGSEFKGYKGAYGFSLKNATMIKMDDFGKTEDFDESKHPRDPETGEFVSQASEHEAMPLDPVERQKVIDEQDELDRQEWTTPEETHQINITALREMLEDGLLQPNTQAIEKAARSFGCWPEDPDAQKRLMSEVLGLSKAEPQSTKRLSSKREKASQINPDPSTASSRLARKVVNQARADHLAAGDPPVETWPISPLKDVMQLYRAHKSGPDLQHGQALRYMIHRIEHVDDYADSRKGHDLDKQFVENEKLTQERKGAYVPPYGLYPIYNLRAFVAQNGHLIAPLLAHQAKLHEALHPNVKMIDGEPHIALVRRYPHDKRHPEVSLSSYSDNPSAQGAGTGGAELTHPFYNWVPLKHVWYSYDHGPREAFLLARRNAQDEFLVSPHKLVDATAADLKKLFPAAHPASPSEREAVPSDLRATGIRFGRPPSRKFDELAAGAVILSKKTGRILIGMRSPKVKIPGVWGTWGGTLHPQEDPILGAHREIKQETGYDGPIQFHPIFLAKVPHDKHNELHYHNLLGVVDDEFEPTLNWEHTAFKWVSPALVPQRRHPGLSALLAHQNFAKLIGKIRKR